MKKIILSLMMFGVVGAASAQETPSADAILDKYLAAIGGKEALSKIEDISISTVAETQRGSMESEVKFKKGNKFSSVVYMMGNEVMRQTCDGTKVAITSGFGGNTNSSTLEGKDAAGAILQAAPFPELLYAEFNVQKTVVGKEAVNGKDAWKVEFAIPEGRKWNDFFDVETGLKVKRAGSGEGQRGPRPDGQGGGQRPGGQRPEGGGGQGGQGGGRGGMMGGGMMNAALSDYKEIKDGNGVKIPYVREQGNGQFSSKAEVTSVKVNKGIKDNNFVIK
ncbi:hypothetical protein FHS57_001684 [Runella defluvii]|uniref:Uncharacterized protein n=1 Tax=Runella defluvii TaxID=370973 RepID=A0A7W5ZKW6_9BACT|nr:hypothetical protein [Runella defluvii]MBB3837687.1 hypothetical protein [Runella defluvii]